MVDYDTLAIPSSFHTEQPNFLPVVERIKRAPAMPKGAKKPVAMKPQ